MVEAGVDPEGIRLLCRHLVNLKNQNAERRWFDWNLASQQNAAFAKVAVLVPLQLTAITVSNRVFRVTVKTINTMLGMGFDGFLGVTKLFQLVTSWNISKIPASYDGRGFCGFSLGYTFSQKVTDTVVTTKTAASFGAHWIGGVFGVTKLFRLTVPPLVTKSHAIGGAA